MSAVGAVRAYGILNMLSPFEPRMRFISESVCCPCGLRAGAGEVGCHPDKFSECAEACLIRGRGSYRYNPPRTHQDELHPKIRLYHFEVD